MKKLTYIKSILVSVLCLVACSKDAPKGQISIDGETAVNVPAQGGSYSCTVTLTDCSAESAIKADCPDSWVEISKISGGTVTFTVQENTTGKSRYSKINISCVEASNVARLMVVQSAQKEEQLPKGQFTITVSDINCSDAKLGIKPEDYSVTYAWGVISKSEYTSIGLDAFIKNRIDLIEGMAALYNIPFEDFLQKGAAESDAINLFDDTEYYVVVFPIDKDKVYSTDISIVSFKTKKAEQSELQLSLSVIGTQLIVTPSTNDTYICDCTLKSTFDSYEDPLGIAKEYVSTLRTYGVLDQNIFSGQHSENLDESLTDGLIPGVQYVCYAIGYTTETGKGPGFTTKIFTKEFTYASK